MITVNRSFKSIEAEKYIKYAVITDFLMDRSAVEVLLVTFSRINVDVTKGDVMMLLYSNVERLVEYIYKNIENSIDLNNLKEGVTYTDVVENYYKYVLLSDKSE